MVGKEVGIADFYFSEVNPQEESCNGIEVRSATVESSSAHLGRAIAFRGHQPTSNSHVHWMTRPLSEGHLQI